MMKKFIEWLKSSNRWKHLLGGFGIGVCSTGWYCAVYAGTLIAGALEFKDKAHGGKWDWIDFGLTVGGAVLGHITRLIIGVL